MSPVYSFVWWEVAELAMCVCCPRRVQQVFHDRTSAAINYLFFCVSCFYYWMTILITELPESLREICRWWSCGITAFVGKSCFFSLGNLSQRWLHREIAWIVYLSAQLNYCICYKMIKFVLSVSCFCRCLWFEFVGQCQFSDRCWRRWQRQFGDGCLSAGSWLNSSKDCCFFSFFYMPGSGCQSLRVARRRRRGDSRVSCLSSVLFGFLIYLCFFFSLHWIQQTI